LLYVKAAAILKLAVCCVRASAGGLPLADQTRPFGWCGTADRIWRCSLPGAVAGCRWRT